MTGKQKIVELSEVSRELIDSFLTEHGLSSEYIHWKYFDDEFNAGRSRGLVAIQADGIAGFLGLIPFAFRLDSAVMDTTWTCDWYLNGKLATGMTGIALLKHATSLYPCVFHTGGNDLTQQIFQKFASVVVPNGMLRYRRTLRLGRLVHRLQERSPIANKLPLGLLSPIPLVWPKGADPDDQWEEGISDEYLRTLDSQIHETAFHPVYDASFLRWQIGRAPNIASYTMTKEGVSALLLRSSGLLPCTWRMVLTRSNSSAEAVERIIRKSAQFAYQNGAYALSVEVSEIDAKLQDSLKTCGFSIFDRVPFHAFYQNEHEMPADPMSSLSLAFLAHWFRF